jgi:hypothetical protein
MYGSGRKCREGRDMGKIHDGWVKCNVDASFMSEEKSGS